jgi:putative nucleotidyltransferase with HDIG domain
MSEERITSHIDVDSIPTLPAIAMEAIRLMEGEHSSFDSIADLLKNDQVLAGRILHYANSAFVGSRAKISTISRAISLLGFNTVRSIILSVSVFELFSGKLAERKTNLVNFWLHSIGVAVTAEALAIKLGFPNPEEAYLAGLVHDIGKLVCYLHFPQEFEDVCHELEKTGDYSVKGALPLDVENNIMGTNHADVGKTVASQWMFPEALANAIWMHHQPVFESITPEEGNLYQLVRFADVLCVAHNIGSSYFLSKSAYDHQHFHFALEGLMYHHNFSSEDIEGLVDQVILKVKEVGNILGVCDEDIYRSLVSSANASLGSMSLSLERRNNQLIASNKVLDATYKMVRQIKSGMPLPETIQGIIFAAKEAFGVERCLCMIRDDQAGFFVGQVSSPDGFEKFVVPITQVDEGDPAGGKSSDIEDEALRRLKKASVDFSEGAILESGVVDIVSGSQFLASFFVADKLSHGRQERIIGELMVDFRNSDALSERIEDLSRNFELFSSAAGSAVERILMEKDLEKQARDMAEASRKMEESQRQLFHSHRLATVGSLAAGAAHEINNPLTIISLNLQIMERILSGEKVDPELLERLKIISDQEIRISKIIGELMGFARPSQPKLEASAVGQIMGSVLAVLADRVSMEKVNICNEISIDLPKVMVDALQIEQVFMNLLINANHSMPQGGRIHLQAAAQGNDFVVVRIQDTGSGIPKKNLAKIFDPFFTTKKEGEGTGLGLAISHSIVEHNGGGMQVESEEGKGTTFSISLPIDKSNRLQAMKKVVDQKRKAPDAVHDEHRILIIDDERLLNDMLSECLRASGYEVDSAYDGVEGIGMLRFKKYHLLLLDIRMPRKDGLEVLKFVNEEYPDIKVIIVTGLASIDEIKNTVQMGAYACIKKPFRIDKILEKVRQALASG